MKDCLVDNDEVKEKVIPKFLEEIEGFIRYVEDHEGYHQINQNLLERKINRSNKKTKSLGYDSMVMVKVLYLVYLLNNEKFLDITEKNLKKLVEEDTDLSSVITKGPLTKFLPDIKDQWDKKLPNRNEIYIQSKRTVGKTYQLDITRKGKDLLNEYFGIDNSTDLEESEMLAIETKGGVEKTFGIKFENIYSIPQYEINDWEIVYESIKEKIRKIEPFENLCIYSKSHITVAFILGKILGNNIGRILIQQRNHNSKWMPWKYDREVGFGSFQNLMDLDANLDHEIIEKIIVFIDIGKKGKRFAKPFLYNEKGERHPYIDIVSKKHNLLIHNEKEGSELTNYISNLIMEELYRVENRLSKELELHMFYEGPFSTAVFLSARLLRKNDLVIHEFDKNKKEYFKTIKLRMI